MIFKLNNKSFIVITLVFVLFLITGCGSTLSNSQQKYYTGYNSIQMAFLSDSPPPVFYYDSESAKNGNYQANTIPISVQIDNKGSSDSYGAIFIHGFDPNIVSVGGTFNSAGQYIAPMQRSTSSFGGWYGGPNSFGISSTSIVGGIFQSLSAQSINGQTRLSFSSFGSNRATLFTSLGLGSSNTPRIASQYYSGINTAILQQNIGRPLIGMTSDMFNVYGWSGWLKEFTLEGRNPNNPAGGMDVLDFSATILTLPPSLEEFRQRVMITSCFDYATHASTMVCIDPEPYSNVKKSCIPQTVTPSSSGQGAPVAITTIEQRPARGKTTFVINIRHNKQGTYDELYDYFNLYKCDPASGATVKTNDKNIVYVGYVYLSEYDITMACVPDQIIRLDDSGNGQITCSVEFPPGMASSAYQAPLEVELWYGYSKTIYKDMIIRRI